MDNRRLYLCEDKVCFQVLNGDDFEGLGSIHAQISSCGKELNTKKGFIKECLECFGVSEKQIIWLKPSEIPRVNGMCCKCKQEKSFQKWEAKHYAERKVCHKCLLKEFSEEWVKENFSEGHQDDFFDEMKREEKGRTLL